VSCAEQLKHASMQLQLHLQHSQLWLLPRQICMLCCALTCRSSLEADCTQGLCLTQGVLEHMTKASIAMTTYTQHTGVREPFCV
jgi:hypothetical protein